MAGLLDPLCAGRGRPSPAAPTHASHITSPTQHKRRRRVHCKSRLGCLSCKQRKIKCNELRPSCSHCHRSGLQCIYVHSPDLSQPFKALPTGFTMEDFRFYHHVLTTALPSLPFGGHRVWWRVAATAHHVRLRKSPGYPIPQVGNALVLILRVGISPARASRTRSAGSRCLAPLAARRGRLHGSSSLPQARRYKTAGGRAGRGAKDGSRRGRLVRCNVLPHVAVVSDA